MLSFLYSIDLNLTIVFLCFLCLYKQQFAINRLLFFGIFLFQTHVQYYRFGNFNAENFLLISLLKQLVLFKKISDSIAVFIFHDMCGPGMACGLCRDGVIQMIVGVATGVLQRLSNGQKSRWVCCQ
ncbi:hypothetical protein LVJ83_12665 [Uruburuella testudinis]|uniref:Uncharacterized protein n=1 Tax=Uruburuella testudinis TaxID=1282863 RepID=A0ABY4DTL7_9NEIS|nr:hypothetical protein [Uruburuella testudinis]UOO81748.1 hypothetical protein LVJ83_12665 [Uruburuella testudinis]